MQFSLIDRKKKLWHRATDGVIDLGARLGDSCPDLKTLLQRGGLSDLQVYLSEPVDYAFSAIRFLPVVENPGKVFCVGMNYADKRRVCRHARRADAVRALCRFAGCARAALLKPATTAEFDYEGELAVIIGKAAYQVKPPMRCSMWRATAALWMPRCATCSSRFTAGKTGSKPAALARG